MSRHKGTKRGRVRRDKTKLQKKMKKSNRDRAKVRRGLMRRAELLTRKETRKKKA